MILLQPKSDMNDGQEEGVRVRVKVREGVRVRVCVS